MTGSRRHACNTRALSLTLPPPPPTLIPFPHHPQRDDDGVAMHAFGVVQKAAAIARQKSWFPTLSSPGGGDGTSGARSVVQRDGLGGIIRRPLCLTFAPRNADLDAEDGGAASGGADEGSDADGTSGEVGNCGTARGVQRSAFVRSFDAQGALEWRTADAGLVLDYESVATQKGLRPSAELRADYEGKRVMHNATASRSACLFTVDTTPH